MNKSEEDKKENNDRNKRQRYIPYNNNYNQDGGSIRSNNNNNNNCWYHKENDLARVQMQWMRVPPLPSLPFLADPIIPPSSSSTTIVSKTNHNGNNNTHDWFVPKHLSIDMTQLLGDPVLLSEWAYNDDESDSSDCSYASSHDDAMSTEYLPTAENETDSSKDAFFQNMCKDIIQHVLRHVQTLYTSHNDIDNHDNKDNFSLVSSFLKKCVAGWYNRKHHMNDNDDNQQHLPSSDSNKQQPPPLEGGDTFFLLLSIPKLLESNLSLFLNNHDNEHRSLSYSVTFIFTFIHVFSQIMQNNMSAESSSSSTSTTLGPPILSQLMPSLLQIIQTMSRRYEDHDSYTILKLSTFQRNLLQIFARYITSTLCPPSMTKQQLQTYIKPLTKIIPPYDGHSQSSSPLPSMQVISQECYMSFVKSFFNTRQDNIY